MCVPVGCENVCFVAVLHVECCKEAGDRLSAGQALRELGNLYMESGNLRYCLESDFQLFTDRLRCEKDLSCVSVKNLKLVLVTLH